MATCVRCRSDIADDAVVCPSCRSLQPTRRKRQQLLPKTQIDRGYGRIVVDARVGAGAMGTVYRAWLFWDPNGPRRDEKAALLALKQLNPEAAIQPELRAFFQTEAEALQLLAHPNVVRFHELFTWSPTLSGTPDDPAKASCHVGAPSAPPSSLAPSPILAMEYVDGDTLEDVIARNVARAKLAGYGAPPGLAFGRAWNYVQQLLGALAAAHALGIVHRDVKPSNILIRRDGIVKLTDFGIAHLARPSSQRTPSSEALAPGTGAYMSPEQVTGQPLDGRSDLYSAAIVLYEALTGRPPFLPGERSEIALRMAQVEETPPPLRAFLPTATPLLEQLFARALAKNPAMRFSSAIEMGDAFRSAFGLPSTPAWIAQAQFAEAAPLAPRDPTHAQKLATLRQVVKNAYRTQPLRVP